MSTAAAAAVAVVAGTACAEAVAKAPRVSLSRPEAVPGQVVRVWARGFPAKQRVRVTLAGRRLLVTRTRRTGRLTALVRVPGLAPGRRVLRLRRGRRRARAPLTVVGIGDAATLVAAGDIACDPFTPVTATQCRHAQTARLVQSLGPDVVATLGDAQYPNGELRNYLTAYHPTWGAFKSITAPAVGNHEYLESPDRTSASGHFTYFGNAAGEPTKGYYSYPLGAWHVFVLNTGEIAYTRNGAGADRPDDCWPVSCAHGSEQEAWLRSRLAQLPPGSCAIAYWHHPRYSSGSPFGYPETRALYDALHDHGVELLLTAHTHAYERFRPMGPAGRVDLDRGVTQFVVGTGGRSLFPAPARFREGSARFDSTRFGVLLLELGTRGYRHAFVAADGSFHDGGGGGCR